MRRRSWVKQSGPFKCSSLASGHIVVQPSWGQYGKVWEMEDGGGPGFSGRMRLASELQKMLNKIYEPEEIEEANQRIALHEQNSLKAERTMKREGHRQHWAWYNCLTRMFEKFGSTKAQVYIQLPDDYKERIKRGEGRIVRVRVSEMGRKAA
ncbi:hypothetical protein LCGC14_1358760 [marine sediment metagenome]|uniref:Uncharacterized protein n=1 Tax=marine sediment metagenome TaxID=412755 RepID=A0A0F9K8M6_9ZZZZ